ncbi:Panacea domain-containing protein [Salinivibrio kushneri]|uniref:Panacea domain-containing protein n=1 Tax=Salinivibrio kushneri TaxID=1908198 RepID=UPI0009888EE4|nr:type II toxin-antitoxin system antitoxin SocA domain-containing protein [Salinivibrio kushneri]OOE32424.1 hypothetical protein BZG04_15290 [Salinivibrio kushneri]OOE49305.1 hypothetical protein BZG12_16070 [Salinivibrio kushneri]
MYSPNEIAALFTKLAKEQSQHLTHMQLQKLTYIAHGFKLAITRGQQGLISEPVNAWKFGPVIPSLYHALKTYGNGYVPELNMRINIDPEDAEIVRAVYETYGHLDGVSLSELTHRNGTPWHQTWIDYNGRNQVGAVIPDSAIRDYYTAYLGCGTAQGL